MHRLIFSYSKGYISIVVLFALTALAAAYYFVIHSSVKTGIEDYALTKKKIIIINEAISTYYVNYGYMPCPAELTLQSTNSSFMAESRVGGAGSACQTGNGVFASNDSLVYMGSVPTRALNLPLEYSEDIWGSRILYVVTQCMTTPSAYKTCNGSLTIKDGSGDTLDSSASYALVSFGPDKMGAYDFQSGSIGESCTISNVEQNNCLYTQSTLIQSEPTFYNGTTNSGYYDDIVDYVNKLGD